MDNKVIREAGAIITRAIWPGSKKCWIENDEEQFPAEGTLMYQLYSHKYLPEELRLTREQCRALLAAEQAALEILKQEPELLIVFLKRFTRTLRDGYDQIAGITLHTLGELVLSGRVKVPYEAMAFAGFAFLFVQYAIDGVIAAAGLDYKDSR
jgi:hypothetical protein